MGVPKFYRWISERYPCLSEVVKEYQIPEFDNLYLDFNGVVHNCSHPEDDNPHFRITEEKIFEDIFHYVEILFRMIRPRKVFFMAIDGVAPRAKMNQQRGRRFRSAREAEELERKAIEKGEVLPKEQRFDSNCITPGTPFMVRLNEQLKYFISRKLSEDKMWEGVRVYLSGHETPGEGEHKIMDFIRHEKRKPDYDPNTRHCLYGLDADLIMLGLVSHEPHFSLLREEVRFGGKNSQKRSTVPEEITFHLLHLSLLREYLDFEFSSVKGKLTFDYDLEHIIDDWVLMGFLVGNDFIPHLPNLHINHDALPMLWKIYMSVLPTLDGYLHENGRLILPRFEKYLTALSKYDVDQFNEQYADLKWFQGKTGKKAVDGGKWASKKKYKKKSQNGAGSGNGFDALLGIDDDDDFQDDDTADVDNAATKVTDSNDEESLDVSESSEEDLFMAEFRHHKASYYRNKLEYEQVTEEVLQEQAEGYVRAIQWILHYYFNGVPSWGWFYQHHYAPYLSDVKNFSNMKLEFDIGKPFLPFEQLMAVLPAGSKSLLPAPLQSLMINDSSPIIEFYPSKFETDLNGKQQDWEAVVLIPFIDEERLLNAIHSVENQMSPSEKARNRHGPHLLYTHTEEALGEYTSPRDVFPGIPFNHAKLTEIDKNEYRVPIEDQKFGLCDNVRLDVYFPGFPTLKHIPHRASLKKAGVKVFQMNSRGENMILQILSDGDPDADLNKIASEYLGESIFVGWPHLFEARVVAVADSSTKLSLDESSHKRKTHSSKKQPVEMKVEKMSQDQLSIWHRECQSITERYHDTRGVDVGTTFVLMYCTPMMGRRYVCGSHGNITLEKQWAQNPVPYALQATSKDISVHDTSFAQFRTLDQLYPTGSKVFMLGFPHYGSQGEVMEIDPSQDGRIRINFRTQQEPELQSIASREQSLSMNYLPGFVLAQRVGISGHLVSRLTGTIFLNRGSRENPLQSKLNIGLNLKFNKRNEEVPGYTKKTDNGWQYSSKAADLINDYSKKFPEVFEHLSRNTGGNDCFYENDIFKTQKSGERYEALTKYLKELPCAKIPRMQHGSQFLDELVVKAVEDEVNRVVEYNKDNVKHTRMQVKPHLLYRPLDHTGTLVPDPSTTYRLFDRVVNVREGYTVPVGLRGTVIGIVPGEKEVDRMYEIVFDEEFLSGLTCRCSANRGYRLPAQAMINLSHGTRKTSGSDPGKTAANRQSQKSQSPKPSRENTNRGGTYASHAANSRGNRNENRQQFKPENPVVVNSKMSREDFLRLGKTAQAESETESSDFLNMWNDLKGAPPGGGIQSQLNLNDAARALKKQMSKDNSLPGASTNGSRTSQGYAAKEWKPSGDVVILKNDKKQSVPTRNSGEKPPKDSKKTGPSKETTEPSKKQSTEELNALFKSLTAQEGTDSVHSQEKSPRTHHNAADHTVTNTKSELSTEAENATDSLKKMLNMPANDAPWQSTKPAPPVSSAASRQKPNPPVNSAASQSSKPDPSVNSATSQSNKPSSQQNSQYGKPVSLQEIFHSAKESQKGKSVIPSNQNPAVQSSYLTQLATWSNVSNMAAPRYDYAPTGQGTFVAFATLGNGLRVQGSACRTNEQASESAAAMALLQLSQMGMMSTGTSPGFMQGPTPRHPSAFTPVGPPMVQGSGRPITGQSAASRQQFQPHPQHAHPHQPHMVPGHFHQHHHHHQHHPGHRNQGPPQQGAYLYQQPSQQGVGIQYHNMQQGVHVHHQAQGGYPYQGAGMHHQGTGHHHQPPQFRPVVNQAAGGHHPGQHGGGVVYHPSGQAMSQQSGDGRVRHHSGQSSNPFVPLQVSKKLATPQKNENARTTSESDVEKIPDQSATTRTATVKADSTKTVQQTTKSKPHETNNPKPSSKTSNPQAKRPRSRLAANFGGGN